VRFGNRAEQCGAAADIVLVVQKRSLYRLANIGKGGKMHHSEGLIAIENCAQARSICDVALFKRPPLHRPAIAAGEIVIGDGLKASRRQRFTRMAANIAGAPGDKNARSRYELVSHRCYLDSKRLDLTFGRLSKVSQCVVRLPITLQLASNPRDAIRLDP